MLSDRETDALRALEASLYEDSDFDKNSRKLMNKLSRNEKPQAKSLKAGLACFVLGIASLFAGVLTAFFPLAVLAGILVTAGIYLSVAWPAVGAKLIARLQRLENWVFTVFSPKRSK